MSVLRSHNNKTRDGLGQVCAIGGRDPFNQNSDRSDREKWTTSKGGPVFPKLFRLDQTDPLSFGPKFVKFPKFQTGIFVEWKVPVKSVYLDITNKFEI